jgi:outer membrane receptor protein involved in Fe transport
MSARCFPRSTFVFLLLGVAAGHAQTAVPTAPDAVSAVPPAAPLPANLANITVIGTLDAARSEIVPGLGATTYTVDQAQIAAQPQGDNAPLNQVILRMPGVAEDQFSQLHLRGEHANLQYRINDVLLPEGLAGFGQELDTRFIDSMQLITGSLPAQYGFRTAGIVDIQTKSGEFDPGGDAEIYGGSDDTFRPSIEYGGASGNLNYFSTGSFDHNRLGIENPTPSSTAIHDNTDQYKFFTYASYVVDDTSRVTAMFGGSHSTFEIPDSAGLPAGIAPGGAQWMPGSFNSATLNENQTEQNYYGVVAYQKSADELNFQISLYGGCSEAAFSPDPTGDLYFDGVASQVDRRLYSGGLQGDFSYKLNDTHTLRAGFIAQEEISPDDTTATVFNLDGAGNPTGAPFPIVNNQTTHGFFSGVYLQDEWKVTPQFTLNYGARFDDYASTNDDENQLSPRINAVYELTKATTLHAGYARYFTPPPLEAVPSGGIASFAGTSNAPAVTQDSPVQAERSNYFDAGISQKLTANWRVGLDGYYKLAKNQLDDGLFGQSLVLNAFNYAKGDVHGVELTTDYTQGGFGAYANAAWSVAKGEDINSAQFLFDPDTLAYAQNHYIFLDHDQTLTGTAGVSYTWGDAFGTALISADIIYGSGLREDLVEPDGSVVPNGAHVPAYATLNLGVGQDFKVGNGGHLKLRIDIRNLTDAVYQLRNGSGVGVNAPSYGARFGIFGTVGISF